MVVKNEGSHQRNYRVAKKGTKRVYEFYKITENHYLFTSNSYQYEKNSIFGKKERYDT